MPAKTTKNNDIIEVISDVVVIIFKIIYSSAPIYVLFKNIINHCQVFVHHV